MLVLLMASAYCGLNVKIRTLYGGEYLEADASGTMSISPRGEPTVFEIGASVPGALEILDKASGRAVARTGYNEAAARGPAKGRGLVVSLHPTGGYHISDGGYCLEGSEDGRVGFGACTNDRREQVWDIETVQDELQTQRHGEVTMDDIYHELVRMRDNYAWAMEDDGHSHEEAGEGREN